MQCKRNATQYNAIHSFFNQSCSSNLVLELFSKMDNLIFLILYIAHVRKHLGYALPACNTYRQNDKILEKF